MIPEARPEALVVPEWASSQFGYRTSLRRDEARRHPHPAVSCWGKRRHRSRQVATLVAAWFALDGGDKLQAYSCIYCGSWHLGHEKR